MLQPLDDPCSALLFSDFLLDLQLQGFHRLLLSLEFSIYDSYFPFCFSFLFNKGFDFKLKAIHLVLYLLQVGLLPFVSS